LQGKKDQEEGDKVGEEVFVFNDFHLEKKKWTR